MLTYTFAKGSGESLYEQLYDRIKADILTGRLAAGEKLPSKRTLADHLELSVITVKNAYEQLIAEGYIYSRERSGYFVSAMDWPLSAAAAAPQKISQLPPPDVVSRLCIRLARAGRLSVYRLVAAHAPDDPRAGDAPARADAL